ncbi:MAG: biliverdin-producing heme oxygenase [Byssovorax sp.]
MDIPRSPPDVPASGEPRAVSALGRGPQADGKHVLAALREQTRDEHQAIEQTLGLLDEALTLATYTRTLQRFHGFWRPVEASLGRCAGLRELGLDPAERAKAPLIEGDLRALGAGDPAVLPVCDEVPRVATTAAALGVMYVLEGASLGGQIISRHLSARLGITKESGGRFFHGYGERTGEMWRAFGAAVTGFALTRRAEDEMVHEAKATFRLLRRWCEPSRP